MGIVAMGRPLNVLFVIKFMSLPGGGAERILATISRGLERRGHRVAIVSQDAPDRLDYYAVTARRIRQGTHRRVRWGRILRLMSWLPALRRVVLKEKPDVAIGFMHSGYLPLGIACLGTGVPMIASEHTLYKHYMSRPGERLLLQLVPFLARSITVVSEQARDSFPRRLRKNMCVVPNMVLGPGTLGDSASRPGRSLLVAIGRLDTAKDHATLINAFAQLAHRWPEWDLEIAGEGACRGKLERQIASLGLTGRVRLLGAVADIDSLLARADLFAMASRYESFGLATAEALMRGVPAIGFADCPGTNELIVDGLNGLLVHPGSDRGASLALGIGTLIADEEMRRNLAANGPTSVADFSEESVLDRWEEILRNAARPVSITT